jgi:hypothetical protein
MGCRGDEGGSRTDIDRRQLKQTRFDDSWPRRAPPIEKADHTNQHEGMHRIRIAMDGILLTSLLFSFVFRSNGKWKQKESCSSCGPAINTACDVTGEVEDGGKTVTFLVLYVYWHTYTTAVRRAPLPLQFMPVVVSAYPIPILKASAEVPHDPKQFYVANLYLM